jgi:hypothetical protein
MKELINAWGYYVWDPSRISAIHPTDRERVSQFTFWGILLKCIDVTDDGYLKLQVAEKFYRVRSEFFHSVPTPKFEFGQRVRDTALDRIGTVIYIFWHEKRQHEYYILDINGRKSSKWCFPDELELAE